MTELHDLASMLEFQAKNALDNGRMHIEIDARVVVPQILAVLRRHSPEERRTEVGELVDIADGLGTCIVEWNEERYKLPAGTKFYVIKITTTTGVTPPQGGE